MPTEQEVDRVRAHTAATATSQVDLGTLSCLRELQSADREAITRHMHELDREWDVERVLQTNASILTLGGVLLGATVNKKFLAVPAVVLGFFMQHALQGWCPPIPVFRRMGVRTAKEINREKYALKAMRGDFDSVGDGPDS